MRKTLQRLVGSAKALIARALLVSAFAAGVAAQSTNVDYPAPVFSEEIQGRIAPRDVGDSRLTRHFYTFNGREGDLTVTVESADLNGDVDLFIAGGLKPLAKVTMYAGGATPTRVARSVYLQKEEALVLRVEARSAGDTDGTYSIRLGGAFVPASSEQAAQAEVALPVLADAARRSKGGRRVNSVGATIEEPTPEPLPTEAVATTEAKATEPSEAATPSAPSSKTTPKSAASRARSPRASRSARTPSKTAAPTPDAEVPRPEDGSRTEASTSKTRRATRRPGARSSSSNARRPAPADRDNTSATNTTTDAATPAAGSSPAAPAVTATRLLIETKDGERIEREMSGVRRVSVENNQVLIVGRDGKTQRVPLASVLRMSIEP